MPAHLCSMARSNAAIVINDICTDIAALLTSLPADLDDQQPDGSDLAEDAILDERESIAESLRHAWSDGNADSC